MCDNFCLWNRETLTEKDFYDYFAEETISIGFVFTQKPEEPFFCQRDAERRYVELISPFTFYLV
ncbi:hypothetical protein [Microcystis sp. M_QC_C_20170808_M3Col]|uniref:hypothetical protein n=1 Tax=Microcystis sp. M_QC_C_20170808_M3Col TaxID=2486216 RepID=UPI00118F4A21|nr:MAG: hypothetical protein EWV84_04055 [Microcystis sp. M_QC_C_20170808_M3Col]